MDLMPLLSSSPDIKFHRSYFFSYFFCVWGKHSFPFIIIKKIFRFVSKMGMPMKKFFIIIFITFSLSLQSIDKNSSFFAHDMPCKWLHYVEGIKTEWYLNEGTYVDGGKMKKKWKSESWRAKNKKFVLTICIINENL